MKKRAYEKPTCRVVVLRHKTNLLISSPYDNVQSPVDTYDDDDNTITDKGGIW